MNNQNSFNTKPQPSQDQILVMIIDHQEKLLPHILGHESILQKVSRLLKFCSLLSLPITATEQYPAGLGPTVAPIADLLTGHVSTFHKTTFSCMKDERISQHLSGSGRRCVVISGIETHICVQQTVCDLLAASYCVHVLADCVGSRSELDHDTGLERMRNAGATVSTLEAFMFEVLGSCKHPLFKRFLSEIMK
ncbi:MAG TPA: hydrolase [bacterium]|nr:hydrolase [bacterium]